MNTMLKLVASFAAGAAIMYYLDPATGRRRRALVRDKGVAASHDVKDLARTKSRRAANRVQGALAKTRAKVTDRSVDDQQLHDRIRAKLGHVASHLGTMQVKVHEGHVVMSGYAPEQEIDELLEAVSAIEGVKSLDNQLSPMPRESEEQQGGQEARH